MDDETLASLRKLLAYLFEDEERHSEGLGMPRDDIFEDIRRVQRWLDREGKNWADR